MAAGDGSTKNEGGISYDKIAALFSDSGLAVSRQGRELAEAFRAPAGF
jgi:hypothetical protein